jgi:outer membrane protein
MNRNNFLKKAFFTLFFISNVAFAGAYSLKDAVNSTLLNNEGIQVAKKRLEIAILEKPKAATEFLPSINVGLNKTFYNPDNPDTTVNYKSSYNSESFKLTIEQDIFTGGSTIARIAAADAKINSAYQEYNKALNEMILKTIQSYQSVLMYRELVKVQQTNVNMAQKSVEKATITVKTGAETKTALFLAKANLASMKSNLEEYSVGKIQTESNFQYLAGEEAPKVMEQIDIVKYAKIKNFDEFTALVNTQNPDLIKAKNDLKASKQGINIAAAALLPRVNLFANAQKSKYSDKKIDTMNNSINGNTYGVGVSVPLLYKGGIQYLEISDAKKRSKVAEFGVRDTIYKIRSDTVSTWNKYISSDSIYKSSRVSEDNYYQTYISSQAEFDVGARTIMDVITVQKKYNESTLDRLQKEASYKVSLFGIYNLIGNLPKVIQNSEVLKKVKVENKKSK